MRTPSQLQEKIAHLLWYKQELIYYFRLIDMRAHQHAVMAAYYRTIDNEIAMLRWVLGEVVSGHYRVLVSPHVNEPEVVNKLLLVPQ